MVNSKLQLRRPYRFLFHANVVCGFMIGILFGYGLSLAYLRHERIDPSIPNQDPYPWTLIGIGLILVVPVATSLVFNAIASFVLWCAGRIRQTEMWGMMFCLKLPLSLMKSHEEEV